MHRTAARTRPDDLRPRDRALRGVPAGEHARLLHGAQLWGALPDAQRHREPSFEHHADLPLVTGGRGGLRATVLLGGLDTAVSPGSVFTPLVGADLALTEGTDVALPLERDFEYAVLATAGRIDIEGVPVEPGSMLCLGCGRAELPLRADSDGSVMLLGGEPFEERLVMWWNFVARSGEEIARARDEWNTGTAAFGTVHGYAGDRLLAPRLPDTPLRPRGRER